MIEGQALILIFAVVGALFVALGIPLVYDKVPPNAFYGFRTRKTLSDENIWYAVNRVTGRDMTYIGVVITVLSLVLFALTFWIDAMISIAVLVVVLLLSVGWMAYRGFSMLRKL
ncbi:MAG: SdpI family protein [Acidobacteria bacterium]|nr:SdpI family protein [Acidobacteriota bacterium]MCW5949693.1 SdpI family protein [Pyrinomonadaceae bacterium]